MAMTHLPNREPRGPVVTDSIYRIMPQSDGTFAVEVERVGALPQTAAGFPTEAAVKSWIAQDKRLADRSDPFRSAAGRKWREG
jgi:hypothetical protein